MISKSWAFLLVSFLILHAFQVLGSALSKAEEQSILYSTWKMPAQFPVSRIESLITKFSNETYGKAFRYLGVEEDYFHGHLIFERKEIEGISYLFPRAILYHTQEDAYKAHWEKSIDPKYDYLNVTTRNWIQWLSDEEKEDGLLIENARKYVDGSKKDPAQFETEMAEPNSKLHYTIHATNLDNKKLGFKLAGELQFEFHRTDENPEATTHGSLGAQGPIEVVLPNGESIKLKLTTNTMFIERTSPETLAIIAGRMKQNETKFPKNTRQTF